MSGDSRARAEAAIREHVLCGRSVEIQVNDSFHSLPINTCYICGANWPCPTVLLARDVLELGEESNKS